MYVGHETNQGNNRCVDTHISISDQDKNMQTCLLKAKSDCSYSLDNPSDIWLYRHIYQHFYM